MVLLVYSSCCVRLSLQKPLVWLPMLSVDQLVKEVKTDFHHFLTLKFPKDANCSLEERYTDSISYNKNLCSWSCAPASQQEGPWFDSRTNKASFSSLSPRRAEMLYQTTHSKQASSPISHYRAVRSSTASPCLSTDHYTHQQLTLYIAAQQLLILRMLDMLYKYLSVTLPQELCLAVLLHAHSELCYLHTCMKIPLRSVQEIWITFLLIHVAVFIS